MWSGTLHVDWLHLIPSFGQVEVLFNIGLIYELWLSDRLDLQGLTALLVQRLFLRRDMTLYLF